MVKLKYPTGCWKANLKHNIKKLPARVALFNGFNSIKARVQNISRRMQGGIGWKLFCG